MTVASLSQAKQLHTVADHLHKRINAQDKMIQVYRTTPEYT